MPKTDSKKTTMKESKKDTKKESKKNTKKSTKKDSKKETKRKPKTLKAYCGIEQPLPKNYRLGSMEECLNAGKVNYYGIKKIDSRLIEARKKAKEGAVTIKKLQMDLMGFLGKENRLRKDLAVAKTVEAEDKIKKEMVELREKKAKLVEKINNLKKAEK